LLRSKNEYDDDDEGLAVSADEMEEGEETQRHDVDTDKTDAGKLSSRGLFLGLIYVGGKQRRTAVIVTAMLG